MIGPGSQERPTTSATGWALLSLFGILGVTVAWWALALWPSEAVPPTWLLRARQVCFDAGESGLPGASGWLLLVGQPLGMVAMLMAVAGDGVRDGLRTLARRGTGRVLLTMGVAVPLFGLLLAAVRVSTVLEDARPFASAQGPVPESYPRLDREPPPLGLVDQDGATVTWDRFAGRPLIVTFGFGHCEVVCPVVVHSALLAQATLAAEGRDIPVVVITLDPWRDTPSRLEHLATQFTLRDDGYILSGSVEEVNRVLDGLEVPRERDPQTGDIAHPSLVFLLDGEGTITYAATGHARLIEELLRRLPGVAG